MLSSPASSPASQAILRNSTNTPSRKRSWLKSAALSDIKTPKGKRVVEEDTPSKRIKLGRLLLDDDSESEKGPSETEGSEEEDSDVEADVGAAKNNIFTLMNNRCLDRPLATHRILCLPSESILRSFVSSQKSDIFKCASVATATDLTPPYACAFSNGAKRGGSNLLAVATEEGSINILDTKLRKDWDVEPQRVTMQPHENGIFDVKWNNSDELLATCSGDHTTRLTSVETQKTLHILRGHRATVKCVAWDPNHNDILTTGSRDGSICLWDLRVAENRTQESEEQSIVQPVATLLGAHDNETTIGKARPRRKKNVPIPRSVTKVLYSSCHPHALISCGSFDGILRRWDLRLPQSSRKSKIPKTFKIPPPICSSPSDPTALHGSRRPRGIISLAAGSGPSEGLLFGLGADLKIHTYALPTLAHLPINYTHENLQAASFSIGIATSPCGRWLVSGSTGPQGTCFLFDVSSASRAFGRPGPAISLTGQRGDISAVDWSNDSLASCADDGTVRIWRPDIEIYRACQAQPEEMKWDWVWPQSCS